ncbi:MAG TPA: tetratricopeptide repeat protein, partial [Abditibacteriaceae bacterium]
MNFVSSRPVLLGASVLYLLGMGVHSVSSAPKTATRKKADSKEHAATNNGTSPRLAQAGPRQSTKNADAASALLRYQMAVDQLLQGRTLEARVLLQDARKKFGDSPEVNLLLASLLQREGRHAEANAVAGAVKNESALAAVWDTQAGATAGVD